MNNAISIKSCATLSRINWRTEGSFAVRGFPHGTYSLTITPASPLLTVVKSNIVVTAGDSTDIETIVLYMLEKLYSKNTLFLNGVFFCAVLSCFSL